MRIVSDLNKPMRGTMAMYPDIPYHWHLCEKALVSDDCVPIQLAWRLNEDERTVRAILNRNGGNPAEGYTLAVVLAALDEFSQFLGEGRQVGYRIWDCTGAIVRYRHPT